MPEPPGADSAVVGAVILAAGASTRMGQPKALLSLLGQPLLARVVATAQAAGVGPIVVAVAPPHGDEIRAALLPLPGLRWAWNPAPELGMLSSVQAALPALSCEPRLRGVLVWPVDIPLVEPGTVRAILAAALPSPASDQPPGLVVPTYAGRGGHPLWLPQPLFSAALALDPALGLRALREHHPVLRLPVDDAEILRDLDAPADVAQAAAERARRPG